LGAKGLGHSPDARAVPAVTHPEYERYICKKVYKETGTLQTCALKSIE